MTYRLRLQPEARDDIREARLWYDEQRDGLGREFVEEVETVLGAIRSNPARFTVVHRHFRRALLHRFPYGIVFAVTDETVQVVACLHARRDPGTWRDRV